MTAPAARSLLVLLGDRGTPTRAVFHALQRSLPGDLHLVAILEESPSRVGLARRRARRLGWWTVTGQVLFVAVVMPILQALGRRRVDEIATGNGLDFGPIDDAVLVGSVNDSGTLSALLDAGPSLVVVHGTRIISERVLREIEVPVVNVHAGITPRYRGVHGGYWAILDDRPDLAGTTVHLVDAGIDTGGILGQATFERRAKDTIATYPYLHLACGLPVLVETVTTLLGGGVPQVVPPLPGAEVSQLHWHPTAWGYMAARLRRGVR